jgi:crotonobetaine/carnitine-CoA ligase
MTLRSEEMTVGRLLELQAEQRGDEAYSLWTDARYSFAETLAESRRGAGALRELGVRPGDRVAIMLYNRPEFLWVTYGLALIGAIGVPLHTKTKGAQLEYYLGDSEPTLVIGETDRAESILPALPDGTRLVTVGTTPELRAQGIEDFRAAHKAADPTAPGLTASFDDPFLLMYTSGTTGPSKGVICPHVHPLSAARFVSEGFGFTPEDCFYTPQPLFHAAGLWWGCLAALWTGSRIALSRFDPHRFWDEVKEFEATWVKAVMAMLLRMEAVLPALPEGAHDARGAIVTPMPLPEVQKRLEEHFQFRFASNYGMTELHPVSIRPPAVGRDKPGSVGKTSPHDEVRIVDDFDHPVPTGEVGEIIVRPHEPWTIAAGYWRRPEATVEAWRNLWFHTGDLGAVDEDGHLYFRGRKKLAIRRSGENISTNEVEQILCMHPAIEQAAIVGVRSDDGEDDVVAYIIRGEEGLSEGDVTAFSAANMSAHMVPRYISFVAELPQTQTFKIDSALLTRRAEKEHGGMWDRYAA